MNELSERSAKHDSAPTFSRGLIRDVTEDKIGYYEHVIKKFERRYGMSFSDFSAVPVVDMNACGRSVVSLYFHKYLYTMLSNKKNNPK